MNDESWGTYDANNDIRFKNSMMSSSLCDYSGGYIHVKGNKIIPNIRTVAAPNKKVKNVIFKICKIRELKK